MIGIDTIEVERIDESDKFLEKIASKNEIEYINSSTPMKKQRIATLFCVKEAVMKALGMGQNSGVVFKDIELFHYESGKPYVILHGKALERFESEFSDKKIDVSISHTKLVATAIAIIS